MLDRTVKNLQDRQRRGTRTDASKKALIFYIGVAAAVSMGKPSLLIETQARRTVENKGADHEQVPATMRKNAVFGDMIALRLLAGWELIAEPDLRPKDYLPNPRAAPKQLKLLSEQAQTFFARLSEFYNLDDLFGGADVTQNTEWLMGQLAPIADAFQCKMAVRVDLDTYKDLQSGVEVSFEPGSLMHKDVAAWNFQSGGTGPFIKLSDKQLVVYQADIFPTFVTYTSLSTRVNGQIFMKCPCAIPSEIAEQVLEEELFEKLMRRE